MVKHVTEKSRSKKMSRPKDETVAKYRKAHIQRYRLMFRRDEDAELIEYVEQSELSTSELFRRAMRLYMEKGVQK